MKTKITVSESFITQRIFWSTFCFFFEFFCALFNWMVITRVLFKRPLPASHITGDLTCRISDIDLKGRLRVVQGLIRTLRKENIDVPDVKNGNWRLIFSLFQCSNLCADVPPPSEKKIGRRDKEKRLFSRFSFSEGLGGEMSVHRLSVLSLDKYVQQELKQRYWDSLCETEAFHQARHRTAGFYCIPNVRDVSVLVAYYTGYLLSRHCELWPKIKSQVLLSDKCTTNLSFQSIVDPTGVWRSTWLFHHICYTSQRLEYLVTFPVNKMYFTWNV